MASERKIIQVNLVPDVKQELIQAERQRNRVIATAAIVTLGALGFVAFLAMTAFVGQTLLLSNADKTISKEFENFKNHKGIDQMITLQNQLSKIDSLHDKKPISSRLFTMLTVVVEGESSQIKVSKMEYKSDTGEIIIEGQSSNGYIGLEKLQKTILGTDIEIPAEVVEGEETPAEPVVERLTEDIKLIDQPIFGESTTQDKVLLFKVGFTVNPKLIASTNRNIVIKSISRQNVTDSVSTIPEDLFAPQASTDPNKVGGN